MEHVRACATRLSQIDENRQTLALALPLSKEARSTKEQGTLSAHPHSELFPGPLSPRVATLEIPVRHLHTASGARVTSGIGLHAYMHDTTRGRARTSDPTSIPAVREQQHKNASARACINRQHGASDGIQKAFR